MSVGQPYLFLGQEFLKNEILTDLYQKISLKFNLSNDGTSNIYLELDDENRDIEKCLSWIQTEVDYISIPDYIRNRQHQKSLEDPIDLIAFGFFHSDIQKIFSLLMISLLSSILLISLSI